MKCQALHDLLAEEGLELMQRVLRLVIIRTVGRTPEELLSGETVQTDFEEFEEEILSEESLRILLDETENRTSIDVLCGLMKVYSNEKPNSDWGNPVTGEIGDDVARLHREVARLHRFFSIFKEISNPAAISLKNYVNLLEKVLLTCLRLEPDDAALQNKYKEFFDKIKVIAGPRLVDRWPQWQDNGGYKLIAAFAIASLTAFIVLR